ncbi:ABC transporter ATP-binding protein [Actinosynnema sp. NPDC047251]|uniref:ABC-type transporter n=1 Tax=Saccharothrix espanaensis (strain ATCC 51144 / DSM 44229 / JCM 9112 / NBRC 15066 / NRRL 15764) TaxID=1179773 RepID=K0JSN2_SACES|nr:ABC transporter ATP-binding protein [Saccharothrix espanaensis]CCH28891.1 ABC-type transporter [Saccharothrix espanaensis DSM 44229]
MGPYLRALAGRRRAVLALLGWSVLEGVPALLGGRLVGLAVDRGFAVGDVRTGVAWLVAFAVLAVLGGFGLRQVFTRLGDVVEPLRDGLVTAIVRGVLRDGRSHRRQPDASAVARITRHVEVVRDATAGLLIQARALLVTTTAALVGLATAVSPLAWLVVLPVVAALVLFGLLLPSLARGQRALVMADEDAAEAAGTVLLGMRDVVACGGRSRAAEDVGRQVDRQARATVRMAWSTALRGIVIAVGGFLPLVLLLVLTPGMVAAGTLTAGEVLAAVVYLSTSVQPALRRLADTTSTVVLRLAVALRRLAEAAPEVPEEAGDLVPGEGGVVLRGVTFGWGEHAEPVVRDLDLDLARGAHLAVVGPSGIGKSTLAGLVTGLVAPQAGTVLLGGAPVREVRPDVRHARIALVPQETYLFTGTVRENLALFAPTAGDDDLLAAVTAVGAADVVARLGGLDGSVGHAGGSLSAGEAQLLAVARVYACPADVVVLDEATSNLDPAAEAVVERAFAARDGILVVIAHRLSSALRAGQVLVMDGGPPLLGTHERLMAESPTYADLMAAWQPATAA